MCRLAGVSRSGFYRFPPDPAGPDRNMKLRDAIQRIALEFPSYGWPRMTAELRRRGWAVNHKRVYRLMRQDDLLCLRRRAILRNEPAAIKFRAQQPFEMQSVDPFGSSAVISLRVRAVRCW